jgi:ABC-type multidrug transport system fused ATPase/permease subunit
MLETLRYIFRELVPHRRTMTVLASLSLVSSLVELTGPIIMAYGIDAAVARRGVVLIAIAAASSFVARAVSSLLRAYVTRRGENLSQMVGVAIKDRLYLRLIALPVGFHHGAEGNRLRDEVGQLRWKISNAISNSLFSTGASIVTLLGLVVYVLWADRLVGAVLFVALIVFGVYTARSGERMVDEWERWNKAWSKTSQIAGDALTNILVVKSNQSEGDVAERMRAQAAAFAVIDEDVERKNTRITVTQDVIIGIATAAILVLLLLRVQDGAVSVGVMTAVLAYVLNAFGQVRSVQYSYRALVQVHAGRTVIEKELLPVVPEDLDAGVAATDLRGGVTFEHVAFRYREDRPILTDVSFTAEAGERIAIVGESGEGKSTIVDLIGRYYDRATGTIRIDAHDVRDVSLRSLRGAMAYVPQDLTLLHGTLEDNIRVGKPGATSEEIVEAVRLAHLDSFVASLAEGMKTVVGERGLKLSGGERQRVALARAFLRKPRILILDEPTSNLDSKTETAVQASLRELMQGRTTFIIAHRLKTVQEMDRILVLKDGVIAEQGTHAELLARKGAYYDLLRAQHLFIGPDEQHLGEAPEAAE